MLADMQLYNTTIYIILLAISSRQQLLLTTTDCRLLCRLLSHSARPSRLAVPSEPGYTTQRVSHLTDVWSLRADPHCPPFFKQAQTYPQGRADRGAKFW